MKIYLYTHEKIEVIQSIHDTVKSNQLQSFATILNFLFGSIVIWDFSKWLSDYLQIDYILVKTAVEKFLDENSLNIYKTQ